jgi:outer membrane protein OmpA-like peptidoglycan-associated protein
MKTLIRAILAVFFFGMVIGVSAQIINVPKRVENKVVNRVNNRIDRGIDKGLDAAEKDIKEGVTQDNKTGTEEKGQAEQTGETQAATGGKTDSKQDQPTLQTYSKFDFIPGEKVIYYEDFSQDAVGDFPALWNTNGSGEVVTSNLFPGNWLQVKPQSYVGVWTDQPLALPENYTFEFDIIPIAGEEGKGMSGYNLLLYKHKSKNTLDGGSIPGFSGFWFKCEYYGTARYRAYCLAGNEDNHFDFSGSNDEEKNKQKLNQKYHVSIWVQKTRLRLYLNENKLFDLPKAVSLDSKYDRFRIDESAVLISNLRIAVGAPDMRNKLMTEGKLVTYGIYFDVNKDVVKPESYGTLKEIAKILNEVPDVKVKITGHTDADGQDAANLDLSKRRAASVKAELAKSFGVNADRLETDGMGESQPVAPNDTPSNKALNRRVEFIKM